jgi:anaerobic magnesium-protoporphyrin IX monomethyl ester cyclase
MPHLALPVLTSALRSQGVEVIQRDLNLETYDTILNSAYLEDTIERLRGTAGCAGHRNHPAREKMQWALAEGSRLAAQVESAKSVFRSPAFYDGPASLEAFMVIAESLELASLPFHPAQLDLLYYQPALPVDSSRYLLQGARDTEHNLFLDLFRRGIVADLVRERPDIIGISVPTMGQMLAAMTLAYLVKQTGLPCHVTVGGPHVTMLRERIMQAPELFDLIDSAIIFDGRLPLLSLVQAVDEGSDPARVPNLVYRSGNRVHASAVFRPGDGAGSPVEGSAAAGSDQAPDFDGLPLDRYLAPDLVLPLVTSHGCYHGRCAFCNVGYGGAEAFHALPVRQLLAQIETLRQRHGVRHVFFADEAMPPRTLRALSEALAEQGSPVEWCGCARFDRALSGELLQSMARGGCRMLFYGLESASERMIEFMVKGTRLEVTSRVLREGAQAGIWNHTFFFFGFPTETMADAQETVDFLYAHQEWIHSAGLGAFILERYSPAHMDPIRFGIKRVYEKPERDLAIYSDYEPSSGLNEGMARTLVDRLADALPGKRLGQYYTHDVHRFLYACYLHGQRRPAPPWLTSEESDQDSPA